MNGKVRGSKGSCVRIDGFSQSIQFKHPDAVEISEWCLRIAGLVEAGDGGAGSPRMARSPD